MEEEEEGEEKKEISRARALFTLVWWPTVSIESRSSSQSRGQIRRGDRNEPKRDAMRCAALKRTNERSIDRQRLNIDFDHI